MKLIESYWYYVVERDGEGLIPSADFKPPASKYFSFLEYNIQKKSFF